MPINSVHKEYADAQADWKKCRDVAYGRKKVHLAGEAYLPKLSHSDKKVEAENYKSFMMRAGFYNATGRTLEGLSGMIFRKDPIIEAPDAMADIISDLTLGGDSLRSIAEKAVDEDLEVGRFGVLVDYPKSEKEGETLSQAEAEALNHRPHASIYLTESIIDWDFERINNVLKLSMVRLQETITVPGDDEFTKKEAEQFRVLDFDDTGYRQRVFQIVDGKESQVGVDILPLMNDERLDFIPFEIVTPNADPKKVCKPPILDLVEVNLGHYRNMADLEHGAHYTALPTPVFSGLDTNDLPTDDQGNAKPIAIGSGEAVLIPREGGKASYLEFTGAGLKALRDLAEDKKQEMATLGARMIASEKAAAETAETHNIKRQGENSALTSVAKSVSASLTTVLGWLRDWAGITGDVSIQLNTDFMPVAMSPQLIRELVGALQGGTISGQTFWWNMQRGEIAPASVSWDDEKELIEEDPAPLGVE